jgi:peroxiredoxin
LAGKKGTVVIYIATKCPVSNAYNDRMEKLAQDYKAKGINVIGINSNYTEPSAEVKAHAAEKHLTFAILKDEGNKIADRWGATRTPEVYVLDASMKLVYHGRIDNSQKVEGITSNDVRDALDEMLAGKPVTKTGGAAFGCTIKRTSRVSNEKHCSEAGSVRGRLPRYYLYQFRQRLLRRSLITL